MSSRPRDPSEAQRVSVVIPAYNSAAYVGEAIDSVLRQTRPVDEILVIDDGSTDGTAERVAPYVERGVHLLQQKNQGVSATRNRGIRETQGQWIAFLDADDLWEPEKIELQLACVAEHPATLLVSGYSLFWDVAHDRRRQVRFGCGRREPRREITVRNFIGNTSLVLVKRDVVEALGGFDPNLRFGEDWEMWIRILQRGPARIVERPLIVYRWHAASNSNFRAWERYDVLSEISRRAIDTTQPASGRGILHRRRRAYAEAGRAAFALHRNLPRRLQVRHAVAALLAYPFDETRQRLGVLVRAVLGTRVFQLLRPGSRT